MSLIFRNLGQFPEATARVLQNLVSANGLTGKDIYQSSELFIMCLVRP